jgi:tRNA(Ile)-lysidine synthase
LLTRFQQFFIAQKIPSNSRLLLGVSGGLDSVVLANLCQQAGFSFALAHCNFNLRGDESYRDEAFVNSLGKKYGVEVFSENFDTKKYSADHNLSIQEAARELRYDFFSRITREHKFDHTLLAHHADDNIETLVMNFFRGTGIKGMLAIPPFIRKQTSFIRPLISIRRNEILQYAESHSLEWVEDSSNESVKYTRNYFRLDLIPSIKKVYPQVEENLLGNIERFKKIAAFYELSVEKLMKDVIEKWGDEWRIAVKKLEPYRDTSIIYEVLARFGFGEKQVPEILKLLEASSGKFIENNEFQIIRHGRWLVIARRSSTSSIYTINEDQDQVEFEGGTLHLRHLRKEEFVLDRSSEKAFIDARFLAFPLVLRKWKQGDYFYPLGMPKKKKIARFLIDLKLSKKNKEDVWVLESNKKIVWIVGIRIDDRVKIVEATRSLVQFTFKRKNSSH